MSNIIRKADLIKEYGLTLEQAAIVLNKVDQDDLLNKEKQKYSFEVWDEESSINGVSAERILARDDIPTNKNRAILKIYKEGMLLMFQPTNPYSGGKAHINIEDADAVANKQIVQIATDAAYAVIMDAVKDAIDEL